MCIKCNKRGTLRKRKREFWDIIHGYPLSTVKIKREREREREREKETVQQIIKKIKWKSIHTSSWSEASKLNLVVLDKKSRKK